MDPRRRRRSDRGATGVRPDLQREHVRGAGGHGKQHYEAFSRFCSGSLAGPPQGFDQWIYLTNEEEGTPANTFDGKGGLAVAIVDNNLYTLPKLGRFAWENTLVQPNQGNRTVIMGMEDGPAALDPGVENSQLYMYVGKKDRSARAGVLGRNGLDNGELYVLVSSDAAKVERGQPHQRHHRARLGVDPERR